MYIITARRITSGELLKQRKGLCIAGSYGTPLPGSSRITLTLPPQVLDLEPAVRAQFLGFFFFSYIFWFHVL
jgi:hypothetical protein